MDDETAVVVDLVGSDETPSSIAFDVLSLALFEHGATAVTQTPDGSLLAGFVNRDAAEAAMSATQADYPRLMTSIGVAEGAQHDWAASQRGGFTPTRVGRWHIRTPWTTPPEDVDPLFDIQIDPGEAFGHGAHPTTKLALQLMDPHLAQAMTMVDIGTGTGVLAIIAARAGVRARAIDNSPAAIEAAQHNVALNSVGQFTSTADRIDLGLADINELDMHDPDLIVANVTIDVQEILAPRLQKARRVIASGVLGSQLSRLRDLYPAHFANTTGSVGEWSAAEFLPDLDVQPRGT